MPNLPRSLSAWRSETFSQTLIDELEQLPAGSLPLDRATLQGGRVDEGAITATVIGATDDEAFIRARVGIFFTETVGGCSCGDEPYPANVFCELDLTIDKGTGEAAFTVSPG